MAMRISLDGLPPELLSQIVSHLENARTLLDLALTCKRIHGYIERDGFRVFVQNQFPSIQTPPYWKDATHALTTLSRAWDRKALVARCLVPDEGRNGSPYHGRKPGLRPRRKVQTMGYQPVIDSYVDWYGLNWESRKEILAWGAGADLVVRVKSMGLEAEEAYRAVCAGVKSHKSFDQHHHINEWVVHRKIGTVEGRDDITSVNLLRPPQKPTKESEYIVVGRASGHLDVVKVSVTDSQSFEVAGLDIGTSLRSASVSCDPNPLVAVCVADGIISIYSIDLARSTLEMAGSISVIPSGQPGRTWSAKFLRHDRLAVGLGPFKESVHVYELRHDTISTESVRRFAIRAPPIADQFDKVCGLASVTSTVYSIAPIASSSLAGGAEGDLFLTGAYDGTIRYVLIRTVIDRPIDLAINPRGNQNALLLRSQAD